MESAYSVIEIDTNLACIQDSTWKLLTVVDIDLFCSVPLMIYLPVVADGREDMEDDDLSGSGSGSGSGDGYKIIDQDITFTQTTGRPFVIRTQHPPESRYPTDSTGGAARSAHVQYTLPVALLLLHMCWHWSRDWFPAAIAIEMSTGIWSFKVNAGDVYASVVLSYVRPISGAATLMWSQQELWFVTHRLISDVPIGGGTDWWRYRCPGYSRSTSIIMVLWQQGPYLVMCRTIHDTEIDVINNNNDLTSLCKKHYSIVTAWWRGYCHAGVTHHR